MICECVVHSAESRDAYLDRELVRVVIRIVEPSGAVFRFNYRSSESTRNEKVGKDSRATPITSDNEI
jgi:hypothetical protein